MVTNSIDQRSGSLNSDFMNCKRIAPDFYEMWQPRRYVMLGWLRVLRSVLVFVTAMIFLTNQHSQILADEDIDFFEKRIRPILVQRCEQCHSATRGKTHGGLALDSQAGWKKGGESGTPVVPGKPAESLLIQAIQYRDDGPQMPPKEAGGKLADSEIDLLTEWVRRGAPDPRINVSKRGGLTEKELREWWSFQPLRNDAVPASHSKGDDSRNEIDRFLLEKLNAASLPHCNEADRRTLARRATYDLTGLPPSAEMVEAFVSDQSPKAYETLVEELLKSPRYGERWGRHWLDVVRYADTAGENTDHPIPDAWRYRNWVIDAFNQDLPYDQFVREQLAGDLLHVADQGDAYANGITSTGFLAIARRFDHDADKFMHLTIEDTIDTIGKAFLGLSIACARCHDHKYDPISSQDYYALYGILNSTRFSFPGCEAKQQPRDLVPLLTPTEWARVVEPFDREVASLDNELNQLNESQKRHSKEFSESTRTMTQVIARGDVVEGGDQMLHSVAEQQLKSIAVDVGEIIQLTIDHAGNYGADSTLIELEISELDGQQRRWNLTDDVVENFLASNPHADRYGNKDTWLFLDGRGGLSLLEQTVADLDGRKGLNIWRKGDNPAVFVNSTSETIPVWTKLPPKSVFVHPAADGPVALGWVSPVKGTVQIKGRVFDAHPGGPNGVTWTLSHIRGQHVAALGNMAEFAAARSKIMGRRNDLMARAPTRPTAYAVMEGTIGDARIHLRGDPEKLGDVIPRRWLELFGGEAVAPGTGSGRRELSRWITDPANPLTARVMVNRIWLQHFGKGLVQTPNDFGTRGERPSHPELLDWLARKFIESGWSVKAMHRTIMLSSAYRRASGGLSSEEHAKVIAVDPNNNLYWRFDRRRLNAEELRDSLLAASQQLDLSPGGPHPVPAAKSWSFTQHVPFAGVASTDKRSVYQMVLRNRRDVFMGLFDGADPNATTPQRQVTTVPTQSLYFLNDTFFHRQAERVAQRTLNTSDEASRVNLLFQIVLQRLPLDRERDAAIAFVSNYSRELTESQPADRSLSAWSALARVLLASNEFLYLD